MRTFVAIDIPEEIRRKVVDLVDGLKPATTKVRWTRPEGLHITLKFIGEIPPEKVEAVKGRLESVRSSGPVAIKVRGTGYFPSARSPQIIWVGIEAGRELSELARQVEEVLVALGIPQEDRPFSAHLTLGRLRVPDKILALQELLRHREPLEFGRFTASEFFLYESKLSSEGSHYRRLARFDFVGGQQEAGTVERLSGEP